MTFTKSLRDAHNQYGDNFPVKVMHSHVSLSSYDRKGFSIRKLIRLCIELQLFFIAFLHR